MVRRDGGPRFVSADEYAVLLQRQTGFSPYQDPRYAAARRLDGDPVVFVRYSGGVAALVREGGCWVSHEADPGGCRQGLAAELSRALGGPVRMTGRVGPGEEVSMDEIAYATRMLRLDQGPSALMEQMSPSCRRNVLRSLRAGVELDVAEGPDGLRLLKDLADGFNSPLHRDRMPAAAFARRCEALCRTGSATIIAVRVEQRVMAMGVVLCGGGIVNLRYTFTAREPESLDQRARPGNGLVWAAASHAFSRGFRWLDLSGLTLGGIDGRPNGIDRFKLGFGGETWLFRSVSAGPAGTVPG